MKERPSLFKGEMVNAILEGRKTQTRRVVKLPKNCIFIDALDGMWTDDNLNHGIWHVSELPCPYGKVGDRLFVREAFRTETNYYDDLKPSELSGNEGILYCADADYSDNKTVGRHRAPMFMPRGLSRITLEITDIRVERLNDISDADSLAEGVDSTNTSISGYAKERYKRLWESINGSGSWDLNPWVWVVEFKKI